MELPASWIIQKCLQQWNGTELLYVDYPTPEGIMTRDDMVLVLERVCRENPASEFRGHNLRQHATDDTLVYDYANQAWVENGKYVRCGHTEPCSCYGRIHEGEPVTKVSSDPAESSFERTQ
jgi:hypothetical protein